MPVLVSMLRAVNVGGYHKIKMDELRALYESLDLQQPRTYIQSGNVVFRTKQKNAARLAAAIESAIEKKCGFHSSVILRTAAELRQVVANNPFAGRDGIEPGKLYVTFLATDPGAANRERILSLEVAPEELHFRGSEMYVYFPNGMGRSKFPAAVIERTLKIPGTSRNWNTVTTLLAMAEEMEANR